MFNIVVWTIIGLLVIKIENKNALKTILWLSILVIIISNVQLILLK